MPKDHSVTDQPQSIERGEHLMWVRLARVFRAFFQVAILVALLLIGLWGHETGWNFGLRDQHLPAPPSSTKPAEFRIQWYDYKTLSERFCPTHEIFLCPCQEQSAEGLHRGIPGRFTPTQVHDTPAKSASPTSEPPRWVGALLEPISFDKSLENTLEMCTVSPTQVRESVPAYGKLTLFPSDRAELEAPLCGTIWRLLKQPYDPVEQGEIIAILDSPELVDLKAEYLQAWIEVRIANKKLEALMNSPISEQEKAKAAAQQMEVILKLDSAAKSLASYGLPKPRPVSENAEWTEVREHISMLGLEDSERDANQAYPPSLLPIRAPFSGIVASIPVSLGQIVEENALICGLINPQRLLLVVFLNGDEASRVRPGQKAVIRAEGSQESEEGVVVWVGPINDRSTAQVPIHIEVPNPQGKLKVGAFGETEIVVREAAEAIFLPKAALHQDGDRWCVFVVEREESLASSPLRFRARMVRVRETTRGLRRIIAGLLPGEVVVTEGGAALWGELQKALPVPEDVTRRERAFRAAILDTAGKRREGKEDGESAQYHSE